MAQPSVFLEGEEGRTFFQTRLARFARLAFAVSAFFFVGSCVVVIASEPDVDALPFALRQASLFHVLGALLCLGIWLGTRRSRLPFGWLRAIDALLVVGTLSAYGAMNVVAGAHPVDRLDLVLYLVATFTLLPRSVMIPSTAARTAAVGVLAGVPVVVSTALLARQGAVGSRALLDAGLWYSGAVLIATLTSRVFYGLRKEVAAAQSLGQYVLDERIGEGGMGIVYRARHALLRRPTAIKLLPVEKAGTLNLARFEREVQQTSRLTHPNTIAVFDYGRTPDGVFYYAMEYLDGVDLELLVHEHGAQDPSRVVHVLAQMCGSLAEAHGLGMVHRDIKPANVILCERGGVADVVKVLDFGLVKDTLRPTEQTALSRFDAILGTPMYLAPEAIQTPETVDARSDLYAVGAVAYRLLTGQHVFSSKSVVEICAAHIHQAPRPLRELAPEVPAALEGLVLSCLAKTPTDRPATAAALREALLALDLPAWTEARARAWWHEHGDALVQRKRNTELSLPHSLSVDLSRRA